MTVTEFFGCTMLAFGPPFVMFALTIANDPIRIIIMIGAAFAWLLSLLMSSIVWFAVVPLREYLAFGMVFSVMFQELFRYGIYRLLRRTESNLREIADIPMMNDNKHVFAYVSGLGFGIISGAFALSNVLADAVGPGTVGLKSGNDVFLITSATMTLCIVLLHTFWGVIFFNALDEGDVFRVIWVVGSHYFFSSLTLLNKGEYYYITIPFSYTTLLVTFIIAYRSIGGTLLTFKRALAMK